MCYYKGEREGKKMKKILALVLCLGMLFTTSSCSSNKVDDKALSKFEKGIVNLLNEKSADYNATLAVKQGGTKADVVLHGQYNAEKDKPELSLNTDLTTEGQTFKNYLELYVKDDYFYFNIMNLMKQKIAINSVMDSEPLPDVSTDEIEACYTDDEVCFLDKDDFKKASIKADVISLQFDSTRVNNSLEDTFGPDSKVSKVNMEITLSDNDMITNAKLEIALSTKDADGKTQSIDLTFEISLKNVNEIKEVTFPDLSDYEEATKEDNILMDFLNSNQAQ